MFWCRCVARVGSVFHVDMRDCVRSVILNIKRHMRLQAQIQLDFTTKCAQRKKKNILFRILPPLHASRAAQAVTWNGKSTRFFSRFSSLCFRVSNYEWVELGMFRWYCTMLENEANADVCVLRVTEHEIFMFAFYFFSLILRGFFASLVHKKKSATTHFCKLPRKKKTAYTYSSHNDLISVQSRLTLMHTQWFFFHQTIDIFFILPKTNISIYIWNGFC